MKNDLGLEHGGIMVAGLYVPPIGMYGFRHLGENVWGPNTETKIKRLRVLGENFEERNALNETLHYRQEKNNV